MIEKKVLNCGTTIVMEKMPHVQSAALGIFVRTGSVDENEEIAGISHFIEHMLFKGTENRTAREIAEDVDRIGGQFNAFTGKESTCYYIKTLGTNIVKGAEILLDMVTNSKLEESEMEKERKVIFEEMKMTLDTPDEDVHDMICELVCKGHPLGPAIIGTTESLERIDRQALTDYMRREYTRDSIVISVAGNFDEEAIISLFEEKLNGLLPSKEKKEVPPVDYRPDYKVKVKDIEQSHICLAVPGIDMEHEDYYAMGILNNIMGGSMSSRFFQNIREEKGLAYSVYSSSTSYSNGGFYNIYAGVAHEFVEEAIEGIREELKLLKEHGVSEEELEMAREQMKSGYIFAQENVASHMFSNGKNMATVRKIETVEEVIEGYDSVTMEDIDRVTDIICDMSRYCAAVISNRDIDLKKIMEG